ncbi:MAG: hypothetical protein R2699_15240 [Acidimicrobiales bacterium]
MTAPKLLRVVPGIRLAGADTSDQSPTGDAGRRHQRRRRPAGDRSHGHHADDHAAAAAAVAAEVEPPLEARHTSWRDVQGGAPTRF